MASRSARRVRVLLVLGVPAVAWQEELAGDVEERLGPLAARQLALDVTVTGPVGRHVRARLEGGSRVADLVLTADRPLDLGVVELQGVVETPEGRVVITAGGVVERTEQGDVVVVDAPREHVRLSAGEPWVAQLEVREQLRLTPQPVHAAVDVPLAGGTLRLDARFTPQRMVQVGAPPPRSFPPVRLPAPVDGTFGVDVLPDGTPVFVGRDGDVVTVLGGQVQLHDDVPRSLIGWCASGVTFEEPLFGTRYDASGRYAFGPGRHGMVPFVAELDGGDVVVSGTDWPQPRNAGADVVDTAPCMTPDTGTLDRHLGVSHDAQTLGLPTVTWSDRPDEGSFVVDATLLQVADDGAVMCRSTTSKPPSCDDDSLPVMDIARRDNADDFLGYSGPFAVTVADGVVRRHVALLGVTGYWGPPPPPARP